MRYLFRQNDGSTRGAIKTRIGETTPLVEKGGGVNLNGEWLNGGADLEGGGGEIANEGNTKRMSNRFAMTAGMVEASMLML